MNKEELQKYVIWALIVIFAALTAYNMHNCNNANNANVQNNKLIESARGKIYEVLSDSVFIGQIPEYGQDTVIILKQVLKK